DVSFASAETTLRMPLASASQTWMIAKSFFIVVGAPCPTRRPFNLGADRSAPRQVPLRLSGGGRRFVRGVRGLLRPVVPDEPEEVLARRRRGAGVAERVGEERAGPAVRLPEGVGRRHLR